MNMNFAYLVQTLKWVTYDKLSLVYRVYHFHPIYWLYLDFHSFKAISRSIHKCEESVSHFTHLNLDIDI